jgi:hypothetical protein
MNIDNSTDESKNNLMLPAILYQVFYQPVA